MRPQILAFPVLLSTLAGACNLTPDYLRPDVPFPSAYTVRSTTEPDIDPNCWLIFRSRTLDGLVTQASSDNTDIAAAVRRVEQARASYRIARSSLFPAIAAGGDAFIERTNAEGFPPNTR